MNFALLEKVKANKSNSGLTKEDFDLEIFFNKMSPMLNYSKRYLEKDPISLLDSMLEIDKLITIPDIEDKLSLRKMLEDY